MEPVELKSTQHCLDRPLSQPHPCELVICAFQTYDQTSVPELILA
jgi:hypothetical protein